MYATKEAILAKQRLGEEIDCSIFIMDERRLQQRIPRLLFISRLASWN